MSPAAVLALGAVIGALGSFMTGYAAIKNAEAAGKAAAADLLRAQTEANKGAP